MPRETRVAGYSLVEVIVALVVFTLGALTLVASSALVARAMGRNAMRDRAARIAVSRIEVIESQCWIATSGQETVQQVESDWVVSRESSRLSIVESVRCLSPPGSCAETYRATVWCSPW
jgi:prepilin-type N-terminal cleavage/methylation domain-containing protein